MPQSLYLFNPWELAGKISSWAEAANVDHYLRILAYGIIAVFFAMNMYRALLTGSGAGVVDALLRAAIAGLLVQNSGVFTDLAVDFFRFMASLGDHAMRALGDWKSLDQTRDLILQARDLIWQGIGRYGWGDIFTRLGEIIAVGFTGAIVSIALAVFFVLAVALFNFLVFMAAITLTVAVMLAPIVFACAVSRFLQAFIWEWLQVVLHASLVIMLAHALVGLIVNQAVLDPLQQFVDQLRSTGTTGATVLTVPIRALMGLGVGLFALLNVQGIASSFVGRVESVAGATVAAMAAMRMAGGAVAGAVRGLAPRRPVQVELAEGTRGTVPHMPIYVL